ncbi:MAG: Fic family protein [Thermodesulfobacteriota bacterium]
MMERNKLPKIPELLPPKIDYSKIFRELGQANKAVGELQGVLTNIPNKFLLIDPMLTNEAVTSSKIEGTQASLEEIYKYEASKKQIEGIEKEQDIKEVLNYRKALKYSIDKIEKEGQPIGENFIKEIHSMLLDSTRGEKKDRGNLRRIQVFVGRRGATIDEANYIPPPPTDLPRLLSNWENYVNMNKDEDPLVIAAVSHYQFEAIHPFMDGSGRIGRILIPIILFQKKYLNYPYLYMSEYFEHKRDNYIFWLQQMDENKIWEDWINFFLRSVTIQAIGSKIKALNMLILYHEKKEVIGSMNSKYAMNLLDILFSNPMVSFKTLKKLMDAKSNQTIYNLLDKFVKGGILSEIGEEKRNSLYAFQELLDTVKTSSFSEKDELPSIGETPSGS